MFDSITSFTIKEHLYLEIPDTLEIDESSHSTPGGDRRARLNQICIAAFLPWFQKEIAVDANLAHSKDTLSSFWEIVNGTPIVFNNHRLLLIPSLAIDNDELRVAQEWIDIPQWIADYYVAVRVNPDDGYIEICGYTTHRKIKTQGAYDAADRTYSLAGEDLIEDLNVLWVTQQMNSTETIRAQVDLLSPIPSNQAENLLKRLGNPDLKFPRLAVPFALWGALLTQDNCHERLYQLRQGLSIERSITRWLRMGVDNIARQLGWENKEFIIAPIGMRSVDKSAGISRELIIADNPYELRIYPTSRDGNLVWKFELQSKKINSLIPAGFKLRLLTEDLQPFPNNEDTAIAPVEMLYLEVMLEPGEGLILETEPEAANYRREVLWF